MEETKKKHHFIILKMLLILLFLTLCLVLFTVSYIFGLDEWKNFDPSSLKTLKASLILYDQDGEEYAVLSNGENRRKTDITELPDHVK